MIGDKNLGEPSSTPPFKDSKEIKEGKMGGHDIKSEEKPLIDAEFPTEIKETGKWDDAKVVKQVDEMITSSQTKEGIGITSAAAIMKDTLSKKGPFTQEKEDTYLKAAEFLEKNVEEKIKKIISSSNTKLDSAQTEKEKSDILLNAQLKIKKANASLRFFLTVDNAIHKDSPIERIVDMFDDLQKTIPEEARVELLKDILKYTYEQHRENPEQYVSHGFDHSLNVMEYTDKVLLGNPEIVESMAAKYSLTPGEGRFTLRLVAVMHDAGYPCVGCRQKSVHGVAGADIFSTMKDKYLNVIGSKLAEDQKWDLFKDFRDAILYHSADKVESSFTAKIHTTTGIFLADHGDLAKVIDILAKGDEGSVPRIVTKIEVTKGIKEDVQRALKEAQEATFELTGFLPGLPEIVEIADEEKFKGRYTDLLTNKDNLLGLEFSSPDLLLSPFQMIRLVDNMDMRINRLSPTQRHPAFREIYFRMGDDHALLGQLTIMLEGFERQERMKANVLEEAKAQSKKFINDLGKEKDPVVVEFLNNFTPPVIDVAKTTAAIRERYNEALVLAVMNAPEYRDFSEEMRANIYQYGTKLSSYDLRHFGGCEPILDVQLKEVQVSDETIPCVNIAVDQSLFDELNNIRITEKNANGFSMNVGVGEYQIWRASEAYSTLNLRGKTVELFVNGLKYEFISPKVTELIYG